MSTGDFDPLVALKALTEAGVDFVLIGGVAARIHGSPTLTRDIDVCHSREPANLERLAAALGDLHARLRGVDDDVPFRLDARTLGAGGNFTFVTDAGDLDVLAVPAGVEGYDQLARTATTLDLGDVVIKVCTLEDLMTMKRAAGRPKDLIEFEVLAGLKDEIAEAGGQP